MQAHSRPAWLERYGPRVHDDRVPKGEEARQAYAHTVGMDGYTLQDAIDAEEAPRWLREVPAVQTLRRIWMQQFYRTQEGVRWRTAAEGLPPAARMISSPYDLDAHYAKKYTTSWVGYKVHFTESCEQDQPHLITHVETTAKQLLPNLHKVSHRTNDTIGQTGFSQPCFATRPPRPRLY